MSELLDFDVSCLFPPGEFIGIWQVGRFNSIDQGIKALVREITKRGEILLEEPQIVDFVDNLDERLSDEVRYVILFRSLPKLEYLVYKSKQVGNNTKKR